MKTKSRLPKFFRRLFTFLEIASPIVGVVVCVLVLALPSISDRAELELELGQVGLMPEPGALTVQVGDSKAGTLSIKNLQGTVSVKNPGEGALALTRWHTLPLIMAYAGFIAVLFDLLRRLFRNVEQGESFTERSVRLVHKIGMTILVFTLLSVAATAWHNHAITAYLEQHATVQGIKMAFTTPSGLYHITHSADNFEFHFGGAGILGVLTGLLVLSLGEVFRQGLALKEDSDLTI